MSRPTPVVDPKTAHRLLWPVIRRSYPGTTGLGPIDIHQLGSVQAGRGVIRYRFRTQGRRPQRLEIFGNFDRSGSSKDIYDFLDYIYHHGFERGQLRVPRPLAYLKKEKLLLYESFPGTRVRDELESGKLSLRSVTNIVVQAGAWLRRFHALPPKVGRKKSNQLLAADFSRLSVARRKLIKNIATPVNAVVGARYTKTLVHGDPHLANCLRGAGQSFAMIDFSESYIGHPLADVGMFLVHLDVALQPYFSRKKVVAIQESFLRSYFQKDLGSLPPLVLKTIVAFELKTAANFLRFTADHHHRPSKYVGWIIRRLEHYLAEGAPLLAQPVAKIILAD